MSRTARRIADGGQATVELAMVLPLIVLLMLALVQVVVLARDQLLVTHAAREAARAAAVDPDPGAPRRAAVGAGPLDPGRLHVEAGPRGAVGTSVNVEVRYREPTSLPIVGRALGDVTLHSEATMRVER
jgi:hypothetical protein